LIIPIVELFGDRVSSLELARRLHINDYFDDTIEFRDYHKAMFGR